MLLTRLSGSTCLSVLPHVSQCWGPGDIWLSRQVFFYKAVLRGGVVEPAADQVADYRWLTGAELRVQLRSNYRRAVCRLLTDHD